MSATGKTTTSTTPSFIAALVTAGITVGVLTLVWLVLHGKDKYRSVYQPRVALAPPPKRPRQLPSGIGAFWGTVFRTPDAEVIVANGVDAYLFTRFLKVFGIYMLIPYALLSCIILIPIA